MKKHREMFNALLDGETLINVYGGEAFIDDDDNLNHMWWFSKPEKWSIKPKGKVTKFKKVTE